MHRHLKWQGQDDDVCLYLHETLRELQKDGSITECLYLSCKGLSLSTHHTLFAILPQSSSSVVVVDHLEHIQYDAYTESTMKKLARQRSGTVIGISNDLALINFAQRRWI